MAKPKCRLVGQDGNIFNLLAIARKTLMKANLDAQAKEMVEKVAECASYHDALGIIDQYVEIE